MKDKGLFEEFIKGIYKENPITVLFLGLCPTLAVTTSLINGLGMGLAASFVLLFSNIIVSSVKGIVPRKIRIPIYIVIIATFVTIVELIMAGFIPSLFRALGIYVPLIVVNCIILGRAEAFASKNSLGRSIIDALGMGVGFTIVLTLLGSVREILGDGKLLGYYLFGAKFEPVLLMILPPGAFILIGLILGTINWIEIRKNHKIFLKFKEKKLITTENPE